MAATAFDHDREGELPHVPAMLRRRAAASPNRVAYRSSEHADARTRTWREVDDQVDRLAAGLLSLGFGHGDKLAIWGPTAMDWCLTDLAALRTGGATVGIYPTLTGAQAQYLLDQAQCRVLCVADTTYLDRLRPHLDELPMLEHIVLWRDGEGDTAGSIDLAALEARGRGIFATDPQRMREAEAKIQPSDLANIVFTSGTTGPPKGACLTHANLIAEVEALHLAREGDETLAFLPMAHVGERIAGHYNRIRHGAAATFVADLEQIPQALQAVRPHYFGSVPRLYEKIHAAFMARLADAPPARRRLFDWAMGVGAAIHDPDVAAGALQRLQYPLADALVLRKVRGVFGGRARFLLCAAAPVSTELLCFFRDAGLPVIEGYGQSETACFVTLDDPEGPRTGSVGPALAGIELRIGDDGEIQARGPMVFDGYYRMPEATRETFTDDGWLATGDIGRLDAEGYLYVTGRKKEIIITAGGENISPAPIEHKLKQHRLVDQALVHGDRRKYLTALLALDPEALAEWGREQGLGTDPGSLREHPAVRDELRRHVDAVNTELARVQTVKDFAILPRQLDPEHDELTPTLKIKRHVVERRFMDLLDALYAS